MLKVSNDKILSFLSIILGVLWIIFFYDYDIGISYTVYTLLIVAFQYFALYKNDKLRNKSYIIGSIYIILLSTIFFRSDFEVFRVINFIGIPFLICANIALNLNNSVIDIKELIFDSFRVLFIPISKMNKIFTVVFNTKSKETRNKKLQNITKVLIGIVISIPFVFVVINFLSAADIVFADKLEQVVDQISNIIDSNIIIKLILCIIISMYLFGQIYYIIYTNREKTTIDNDESVNKKGFDRIISITITLIIDMIYVFFCIIQFIYLFGKSNNLPQGYTYAEYAREGFFQLVFLSVVNIIFVHMINKFYLGIKVVKDNMVNRYKKDSVMNILLFVMVLCTFVLIFSSLYRMNLYENAYGYTRLRLLVHMFIILEAVIMIFTCINIFNKKFPAIKITIVVSLLAYLIINFVNIDSIIAKENIDRYIKTGKIDSEYLFSLSTDAVGEMEKLKSIHMEIYNEYKSNIANRVDEDIHWQSFNISHYDARKILHD
ncbi:hypothetical protein SH1V18_39130 [Vallitalea longa]|uniref:DUF4173 domain-containing protein n=1 Tax=Vallitalea longa TaxID=2936439 RepID=A0A9W5YFM4_9FIRM|nr:DUF4173 domain-containing protein [Vallitalea longa]GKX31433.1 hypothetical protein SH1V18_39130 [Vallitalea longa]